MLVIRERRERNPRFDRPSATGQLQTLGRGGRLGPVPTGLLGSVKEAVLGSRRPVDRSEVSLVCSFLHLADIVFLN